MIFPGGFKQFNIHSRRSESRQDHAQGISKDCQSNHGEPEINMMFKVFWNLSQLIVEFQKLWRDSVGCLKKSLKTSLQTWTSLQREDRVSIKTRMLRSRVNTDFKRGSEELRVSLQTQVWATQRFSSNASLSNSAFLFKRGSEQLCVSISTRACELRVSTSMRLWEACERVYTTERSPRPMRDLHFCCNWSSLLGQLTPHIMWELIPIMEEF